jgi:porphobilinogen deaminase
MTPQEKKDKIKELVSEMLKDSQEAMAKQIDRVLNSGAIDVDGWDEKDAPMVLPKTIMIAILQRESVQYEGRGTCHEKKMKKEVRNILYFI